MKLRWRRVVISVLSLAALGYVIWQAAPTLEPGTQPAAPTISNDTTALATLDSLAVKGRAPKTDYSREQFGNGWIKVNGCDTRNIILYRDLENPVLDGECDVVSGTLNDPYTGETIHFQKSDGNMVQIDHVVALSDAWQKGAQLLSREIQVQLANDPLELLAVAGSANQQKGDADAASWLPKHKPFRCEYVARQIAVKQKYDLWVTEAESNAMRDVLGRCPGQRLPAR